MIVHRSFGNSSINELNKVVLPTCIPFGHPSSKWLLNTFRNAANNRLISMVKERPHMFRHTFQIFDNPTEVMADPKDTKRLFNKTAILYLKPLSLAVYMRCISAVEILLESNLCNPMEYGYASDVYVQLQGHNGGDLLELLPACIAVRRQFQEVLPLLFKVTPWSHVSYSPRTSFSLRYISKRIQRTTVYDDIFHYVTEIAQNNRHVNIVRTLDILITRCPGFYAPGRLDENRKTELYSLFRRLIHIVLYVDTEGRICFPLIQCMDLLVRYSHFLPDAQAGTGLAFIFPPAITLKTVQESWSSLSDWTKDCYVSVALLFQLYAVLLEKTKSSSVGHAGNLLFRVLIETGCFDTISNMSVEELAAVLDFVLLNDGVGRELQQDRKFSSPPKERPAIEQGDCKSGKSFFSFGFSQDLLALVVNKLQARHKLAQLRRMHLLCLTRSNRMTVNGAHIPRMRLGHPHSKFPCKPVYSFRPKGSSHLSRGLEQQASCSITESEPQGILRTHLNSGKFTAKCYSKSECISVLPKARCRVRLDPTTLNKGGQLTTEDKSSSLIMANTTIDANEDDDQKGGEMRSSLSDSSKTVPPPRSFQPQTIGRDPSEDPSFVESCRVTSDYGSASWDIPSNWNRVTNPTPAEDIKHADQSFLQPSGNNSHESVPLPSNLGVRKEERGAQSLVNALICQKSLYENMSLREVDQLIDCITTNALANEKELESQIIEDLFNDYMDHSLLESDNVSCANSVIGIQVYTNQVERENVMPLELGTSAVNADVPSGTEHSPNFNNVNVYKQPGMHSSIEISHTHTSNSFKDSEHFCSGSVNTNSQAVESLDADSFSSANQNRKHLWSCTKPISHLNNAIDVLKQLSGSKRSTSRTAFTRTTITTQSELKKTSS